MSHIIVINGKGGSGKDTFAEMCLKYVPYGKIISTVEFVKKIAYMCGLELEKTLYTRKKLSELKDLLSEWNDVPFRKTADAISMYEYEYNQYDMSTENCYIFIMSREPDDIKRYVNVYDATTILLRRDDVENQINHADNDVENYNYDYIIENNGSLSELDTKAEQFMNTLKDA